MTLDQLLEQIKTIINEDIFLHIGEIHAQGREVTQKDLDNMLIDVPRKIVTYVSDMVVEAVGDKQPLLPPPTTPDYGMHSTRTEDNELIRCENNLRAEILQKLGIKV